MSNHVEQVPMRAGADRDGRGGSDVRRLHVEAPGMAAPESACCRDRPRARFAPVRRTRSSAACRLARLSAFEPHDFKTLAVLIKLGDARNALAVGTRTSPAAFQVTAVGRAAKVKVIVGSAGVHRTGSPAPAHPRPSHPPAVPPPSPPPSRSQGSSRVAPERQSARMRPIGPPSRGRPATTVLKLEKLSAGSESRPWYAE